MHTRTLVFASLACALLMAGAALAARLLFWRPVMPEIIVELRAAEGKEKPRQLMLIYGETGSDPFRSGRLGPNLRLSTCDAGGLVCVAQPARHEFRTDGNRRQSLQIREINMRGNPILGGVVWTGWSYPKRVKIVCDVGAEPRKACAIEDVET